MRSTHPALALALTVFFGVLTSSCATETHSTVHRPTYVAQSAGADCRPGDSSMVCCIKKFPFTAMESCGATAVEVAEVLNGAKVLNEAAQPAELDAPADDAAKAKEDDFANNDHLPQWKQECIKDYVDCQNKGWTGNCHDCLRRCEGQHEWPFTLCAPSENR